MGPMIEVPEELQERVSRLVDMSVACRYLAAQCQVCWCRPLIVVGYCADVMLCLMPDPARKLG
jgi:hypothetical protein